MVSPLILYLLLQKFSAAMLFIIIRRIMCYIKKCTKCNNCFIIYVSSALLIDCLKPTSVYLSAALNNRFLSYCLMNTDLFFILIFLTACFNSVESTSGGW